MLDYYKNSKARMLIFQYLQGKLHEIPISRMFINRFTIVYKLREKYI